MSRITVALETLLRKSVGLAPRGAECCNATPDVPSERSAKAEAPVVADAELPAESCCGSR